MQKFNLIFILIGILFEIVVEFPLTTVSKYIDSKLLEDSITNTLGIIIGVILSLTGVVNSKMGL